ncbi:MAG: ParB/RepB/Spo0J family partition protein [Betaproteobacteria bacterium]|nr:ParB/RepB/Spo0J family partition protein [Betaproteobacteria bacterium]
MAKLKGLGRGLDALLAGDETATDSELRAVSVAWLQPGKYQPRTRMDEESLNQLADSIKAQGIMQPILVRPLAQGRYEIIAGERRWRAARLAGLLEVPVLVREVPDEAALAMSLIENIQRENLNPLEEAVGIQRLIDEFSMTHQSASEALGRSRAAVSNLLRLLNLTPPVQALLMASHLDMGHARALLSLAGPAQIEAAQRAVREQWSVRETERFVARLQKPAPPPKTPDRDVVRLEEELSERVGAKVSIRSGRGGRGRLTIHYGDLDALERLVAKLTG